MAAWYPLKLSFHVRSYAFGERLIPEKLGKQDLPEGIIAETWEVSDYQDTSGTVLNGHLAGKALREIVQKSPEELVGRGWQGPHFPLLLKFLDASHQLPIHLHADDETAERKYGEPNGKTEAWHILWAVPGASILVGIKPGVSDEELFKAFKAQDYESVMMRYPIAPGDTVYVPGGILHTFGPDTLIFEVQQTSDLSQAVMPADVYGVPYTESVWDANIRETLDELRRHYQPKPTGGLAVEEGVNKRVICAAGPHFALERWTLSTTHLEATHPRRCTTLSNLGDRVRLEYEGGTEVLERAESCILPAAIGEVRIIPETGGDLIACYLPDLERDIIKPLRDAWFSEEEIRQLGEVER
ncbi:MAG: hypothetical protein JSV66_10795 [Trueperaceae bacterium]|nr:MAG: hypothetical protein JSV66_10795 [Trueperaceae bacterium]